MVDSINLAEVFFFSIGKEGTESQPLTKFAKYDATRKSQVFI